MLDVRRLRVLREVAQQGSFSAAAESLAFTQSAISQQIAALEREAGTRLVERNARGITLTDAGRALVAHADVVLARLADAERELDALAGVRSGRVRMAAFPSVCSSLMPVAIARYRERFPGVELQLVPMEPPEALAALRCGDYDIALVLEGARALRDTPKVDELLLLEDQMHVVLPKDHSVASASTVRLEELAEEQWMMGVGGDCPDTSLFWAACRDAGFEPSVPFDLDDYNAIQGFVAAGMGVAVIPEVALTALRDDVVVRQIAPNPPSRRIIAATLEDSFPAPAREAMLEILTEVGIEFGNRQCDALLEAA